MKRLLTALVVAGLGLGLSACGDKGPSASEVENVVKLRLLDEHLYKTVGEGGYKLEEHLSEVSLSGFELSGCKAEAAPETYLCTAKYQATVGGEARPMTMVSVTLEKKGSKWSITSFAG